MILGFFIAGLMMIRVWLMMLDDVDEAYGMAVKLNCLYKVKEVSSSESADDTS